MQQGHPLKGSIPTPWPPVACVRYPAHRLPGGRMACSGGNIRLRAGQLLHTPPLLGGHTKKVFFQTRPPQGGPFARFTVDTDEAALTQSSSVGACPGFYRGRGRGQGSCSCQLVWSMYTGQGPKRLHPVGEASKPHPLHHFPQPIAQVFGFQHLYPIVVAQQEVDEGDVAVVYVALQVVHIRLGGGLHKRFAHGVALHELVVGPYI